MRTVAWRDRVHFLQFPPVSYGASWLITQDLDNLEARLDGLQTEKGFEVFPLSTDMLERPISLTTEVELKSFDNSIPAAILVRAQQFLTEGERDLAFCELDSDLRPWNKNGRAKRSYNVCMTRRTFGYNQVALGNGFLGEGGPLRCSPLRGISGGVVSGVVGNPKSGEFASGGERKVIRACMPQV